jgi:3-keto-5-aminohexanoate cleavage enzyme
MKKRGAKPELEVYSCQQFNTMSIIIEGDVRVGSEDNVFYKKGELLKSNAQAVERVVRVANELGRYTATSLQARRMLGFSEQPSTYG